MRSLLFVPGDDARKLEKSVSSDADVLIVDLEDSVATSRKDDARSIIRSWWDAFGSEASDRSRKAGGSVSPARFCLRINPRGAPAYAADVALAAELRLAMVMLPKANSGADVATLADDLRNHSEAPDTRLPAILPLVTETPRSILSLASYRDAAQHLAALTWGAEDLAVELGAQANRGPDGEFSSPFRMVRDLTLIAAADAGVTAIDTVFTDFRDQEGLAREAGAAARDGFSGKLAIHPGQVPIINAAFTPSDAAIAEAQAVIAAFADAGPDAGVASVDGRMVDEPHRRQAERLLARAARLSDAVDDRRA
ncbi:MAG: CoA ester lyase [Pseudomonadota bacterium]